MFTGGYPPVHLAIYPTKVYPADWILHNAYHQTGHCFLVDRRRTPIARPGKSWKNALSTTHWFHPRYELKCACIPSHHTYCRTGFYSQCCDMVRHFRSLYSTVPPDSIWFSMARNGRRLSDSPANAGKSHFLKGTCHTSTISNELKISKNHQKLANVIKHLGSDLWNCLSWFCCTAKTCSHNPAWETWGDLHVRNSHQKRPNRVESGLLK